MNEDRVSSVERQIPRGRRFPRIASTGLRLQTRGDVVGFCQEPSRSPASARDGAAMLKQEGRA